MCLATSSTGRNPTLAFLKRFFSINKSWWPLPIALGLLLVCIPPQALLDGGYTRWHFRLFAAYLLTQNQTLCKFLVVQGLGINASWYTAAAYNYLVQGGEFGSILYRNSAGIRNYTLEKGSWGADKLYLIDAPSTVPLLALCHVMDLLVHIGPLYAVMHCCKKSGYSMDQIFTLPVVGAAFLMSRLFTLSRRYFLDGEFGLYYFGRGAYWIPATANAEYLWLAGYTAEALTFLSIAAWIIWKGRPARGCELKED